MPATDRNTTSPLLDAVEHHLLNARVSLDRAEVALARVRSTERRYRDLCGLLDDLLDHLRSDRRLVLADAVESAYREITR